MSFNPVSFEAEDLSEKYNPMAANVDPVDFASDSFPLIVWRLSKHFDMRCDRSRETFRAAFRVAIKEGFTSVQDIREKFGDDLPRDIHKNRDSWPLPKPSTCQAAIRFLNELDTSNPSGNKLPWRHSQYARFGAEPAPQG